MLVDHVVVVHSSHCDRRSETDQHRSRNQECLKGVSGGPRPGRHMHHRQECQNAPSRTVTGEHLPHQGWAPTLCAPQRVRKQSRYTQTLESMLVYGTGLEYVMPIGM